jgi:hypothetical protein
MGATRAVHPALRSALASGQTKMSLPDNRDRHLRGRCQRGFLRIGRGYHVLRLAVNSEPRELSTAHARTTTNMHICGRGRPRLAH